MFTTVRRAMTGFAVLASAVAGFTALAPAANAADAPTNFLGGTTEGVVVIALTEHDTKWSGAGPEVDYNSPLTNAHHLCNDDNDYRTGLTLQIRRYRQIDPSWCTMAINECAHQAYYAGRLAGITFTNSDEPERPDYRCWTYPNYLAVGWQQPAAPALAPARVTDPRFVVLDNEAPALGPQARSTLKMRGLASETDSIRVSGAGWFVRSSSLDRFSSETQSQLLTYVDHAGEQRMAWAQPHADGTYDIVSFDTSDGKFVGGKYLQPANCLAAGICHRTNSINYLGADGHRYTASLEAAVTVGTPTHSANSTIDTPITFDAADFAPARTQGALTYQWRFQRSSVLKTYGTPVAGRTVAHQWSRVGTYAVELTVTDAIGRKAVTTMGVVLQ